MIGQIEQELAKTGIQGASTILRRIFIDYLGIDAYFKIQFHKFRKKVIEIGKIEEYWKGVLGPIFLEERDNRKTIFPKDVIEIKNKFISDWGPISPGRFWTIPLSKLVLTPDEYNIYRETAYKKGWSHYIRLFDPNARILKINEGISSEITPKCNPLSYGQNSFRNNIHFGKKLLFITDRFGYSVDAGIPIIVSNSVYLKITDELNKFGAVHFESISGIVEELPPLIEKTFIWPRHVPKYCLCLNSPSLLKKPGTPKRLDIYLWNAFVLPEGREILSWKLCCIGHEDYEKNIIESIEWIYNKVGQNVHPLFEIDEKIPRFPESRFSFNFLKTLRTTITAAASPSCSSYKA